MTHLALTEIYGLLHIREFFFFFLTWKKAKAAMLVIFLKYGCKKFCHLLFLTFFANFVLKFDFEKRQFQKVGVVLAEFYLFQLPLLRVLGVSYFKITKVLLSEFSPLKCLFLLILNKTSTLCNHSFRD